MSMVNHQDEQYVLKIHTFLRLKKKVNLYHSACTIMESSQILCGSCILYFAMIPCLHKSIQGMKAVIDLKQQLVANYWRTCIPLIYNEIDWLFCLGTKINRTTNLGPRAVLIRRVFSGHLIYIVIYKYMAEAQYTQVTSQSIQMI